MYIHLYRLCIDTHTHTHTHIYIYIYIYIYTYIIYIIIIIIIIIKILFHKGTDRAGPFMGHFTPPVERCKK